MAVEAHARLEAERVARAEADKPHVRVGGNLLGDADGVRGGDGHLEAVLAGVSSTGDVAADLVLADLGEERAAKLERSEVRARERLEHLGGLGALERDEAVALEDLPVDRLVGVASVPGVDLGVQVRDVLLGPAGVGHNVPLGPVLGLLGHDRVVDDAALVVEEDGERGSVVGQLVERRRREREQKVLRARAGELVLQHVRHVEQARLLADVLVRRDWDVVSGRALKPINQQLTLPDVAVRQRHVPPGKGHHLAAVLDVEVVQRGALELCGGEHMHAGKPSPWPVARLTLSAQAGAEVDRPRSTRRPVAGAARRSRATTVAREEERAASIVLVGRESGERVKSSKLLGMRGGFYSIGQCLSTIQRCGKHARVLGNRVLSNNTKPTPDSNAVIGTSAHGCWK